MALAIACGGEADKVTVTPAATSSSPVDATATQPRGATSTVASLSSTPSASPAAAIPIDAIGARLGGARESWIEEHGEPVSASPYERFGRFELTWSPEVDGTQRAMTVEVLYPSSGVSVENARRESEALMPPTASQWRPT